MENLRMAQLQNVFKMHQTLFILLAVLWCMDCDTACPLNCVCEPEGRGQSVWCYGENLTSIISELPHNTARLKINGVTLQSLGPADLEDAPKSIQHLTITNTSLQRLEPSTFSAAFTFLQELDLSNNKLSSISAGTFNGLNSLRLLNLSGNDIELLASCLEPLVSLQQLDLSYNFIHELQPSIFHGQSSLSYLRLDGNKIRSLSGDVFQALSFLTELMARNCSIVTISESFFMAIPRVCQLDLSNNRLNSFPSSAALKTLQQLQHLYLHDNRLLELQANQFDGLHLLTLSLAHNRIGALRLEAFNGLTVKDLDLSHNMMMELDGESLRPLAPQLLTLNLAHNPIRVLQPQVFKDLRMLETLNISACSLKSVPAEIFSNLYNLRSLDVSWNYLQNISEDLIKVFSRLVKVGVQHNPWHCDCHITPFRNWLRSRQSIHKLFCSGYSHHSRDCTDIRCSSPDELKEKMVFNLSKSKFLKCGVGVIKSGLSVPVQITIVLVCLLFAFGMLFLTMYLWRRGHTRRELKQIIFQKKQKPDSHEEDEEDSQKIEPFLDCDNESLKESHRSFVFKQFFDQMVTDPKLLDPPSPSEVDPSESEVQVLPRQKDSMYSSNPSLYETSYKSCSAVVVGIESAV